MLTKPAFAHLTGEVIAEDDELGYKPLARHLADALDDVPYSGGYVAAITGPWGSGKSSCISFCKQRWVEYEVKPIVIEFSPWLYNDKADLVRAFFEEFKAGLRREGKRATRNVVKKLGKFSASLYAESSMGPVSKAVAGAISKSIPVTEARDDVNTILATLTRRVIVIVDDLDRLPAEEAVEVLRLIKSVGKFQNTVYVLAYDRDNLARAVKTRGFSEAGEQYLEKIIQFALPLPQPSSSQLRQMLASRMDMILAGHEIDIDNAELSQSFDQLWFLALSQLVQTPRDVKRLIESFVISFEPVKDEVHPIDFLAVESLRVLVPDAYRELARETRPRSAEEVLLDRGASGKETVNTVDQAAAETERDKAVRRIREMLSSSAEGTVEFTDDGFLVSAGARANRFAHPSRNHPYFWLGLPAGMPSRRQIDDFLAMCDDEQALSEHLKGLSQDPKAPYSLQMLLQEIQHIGLPSPQRSARIAKGLFMLAHELGSFEKQSLSDNLANTVERIVRLSIERQPTAEERVALLSYGVENCRALGLTENLLVRFASHPGEGIYKTRQPDETAFITETDSAPLFESFVRIVTERAQDGSLINERDLLSVLYRFQVWAGEEEFTSVLGLLLSNPGSLGGFVERTASRRYASSGNKTIVEDYYDLRLLGERFNLHDLESIAQASLSETSETRRREALRVFIRAIQSKLTGDEPDNDTPRTRRRRRRESGA